MVRLQNDLIRRAHDHLLRHTELILHQEVIATQDLHVTLLVVKDQALVAEELKDEPVAIEKVDVLAQVTVVSHLEVGLLHIIALSEVVEDAVVVCKKRLMFLNSSTRIQHQS